MPLRAREWENYGQKFHIVGCAQRETHCINFSLAHYGRVARYIPAKRKTKRLALYQIGDARDLHITPVIMLMFTANYKQ